MKYKRKPEQVEAQQWMGDLEKITITELRQIEGLSGYNARLAYLDLPSGKTLTVRPKDYIVKKTVNKIETLLVMTCIDFEEMYEKVANGGNKSNNKPQSKDSGDNFLKDAPKS